jgi:hypothetical protein
VNPSTQSSAEPQDPASLRLAVAGAAGAVIWFLARALQALPLLEFGDETEHYVVARMLEAGERLYSTVFANHGPLPYALSHLWLLLTGAASLASYRLMPLALYALCAAAIYASPVFTQTRARLHALTLFLVPLGVVYAGTTLHMVMYQGMAGALLTIELALFALPAVFGVPPPRWAARAAGFAASLAVFAAFSFGVAAALLAAAVFALPPDAAGLRRRAIGGFLAGALAGVLLLGTWISLFADWPGYFVYHYYVNLTAYTEGRSHTLLSPLRALARPGLKPDEMIHAYTIAVYAIAVIALIALGWRSPAAAPRWRWILGVAALAVGVAYFNPLGGPGFQASTLVAGAFGFGALMLAKVLAANAGTTRLARASSIGAHACIAVLAGILVLVSQFARSSPHALPLGEVSNRVDAAGPSDERIYRLIRELVPAGEGILAVVFAPSVYVFADRLPVSGHTYYLPMQGSYARQPLWGYHIDLCKDVTTKQPKVVYMDDELPGGKWGFDKYASCAHRHIVDNYEPLVWAPHFYVRRDIAAARPDILR